MKHYTLFYKGLPLIARFHDMLYMCIESDTHYIIYDEWDNRILMHVKRKEAWEYMFEKSNKYGLYTENIGECMKCLRIF